MIYLAAGRAGLVGIPGGDRLSRWHSAGRRKGMTVRPCRRMKHAYPRAFTSALEERLQLLLHVTHRFPLAQAAVAFALNATCADGVVKAVGGSRWGSRARRSRPLRPAPASSIPTG